MSKELVVIENENILDLFTKSDYLDEIIKQVEMEVVTFEHDLTNDSRRKKTASLARKVASTKTYLDGLGKDLVSEQKARIKIVDESRKSMRDRLDELRDLARKPLTEWELEEKRITEEKAAKLEAERLAKELESDHEMGLLMHDKFIKDKEDKRLAAEQAEKARLEQEEKDKLEREALIAKEAKEAAELAAKEREAKLLRENKEAKQREEQAKIDRIKAEEQLIQQRKDAESKRLADIEQAKQLVIQRQKDEQERIENERAEREANAKHKGKINRSVRDYLMDACELTDEQATNVVKAIANKSYNLVTINY